MSVDIVFDIADGTLPAATAAILAEELTDLGREFGRRAKRHTIQSQPTVIEAVVPRPIGS